MIRQGDCIYKTTKFMLCYLYRSIIHIEGQWNVILRQMEADDMIPASPQF